MRKRHTFSGNSVRGSILALWAWVLFAPMSVLGEPEWWTDTPKALLEAAVQNNKSIVLYFESKGSLECERMESETWSALDSVSASKFLWKRCMNGTAADQVFFDKYDVTSVPEIVVVDAEKRERGRLRGFIGPDLILSILNSLPTFEEAGSTTIFTYGDGQTFTADEALAPGFDASQHLYYLQEDFEGANTLADLNRSVFDPYVNPYETMRIDPAEGYFQSKGLLISGNDGIKVSDKMQPAVAMRIDLSESFGKVKIVLGYIEVRIRVKVIQLVEDRTTEVMALTILPRTAKAPTVDEIEEKYRDDSLFITRSNQHVAWKDVVIRTRKPVNFKQQSVWLNLWVNGPAFIYVVDDLRVRILTEEQTKEETELSQAADPNQILGRNEEGEPGKLFKLFDTNKDGKLDMSEFPKRRKEFTELEKKKKFPVWFSEADLDKSGFLEPNEYRQ